MVKEQANIDLAVFALLITGMILCLFLLPPFMGADELGHYRAVMAKENMDKQSLSSLNHALIESNYYYLSHLPGEESRRGAIDEPGKYPLAHRMEHRVPWLYYKLLAALLPLGSDHKVNLYLCRIVSFALGLIFFVCTFLLLGRRFSDALNPAVLLLLFPQLLILLISVNADSALLALAGTYFLIAWQLCEKRAWRHLLAILISQLLMLCTRRTGLFFMPATIYLMVMMLWGAYSEKGKHSMRKLGEGLLFIFSLICLGLWFFYYLIKLYPSQFYDILSSLFRDLGQFMSSLVALSIPPPGKFIAGFKFMLKTAVFYPGSGHYMAPALLGFLPWMVIFAMMILSTINHKCFLNGKTNNKRFIVVSILVLISNLAGIVLFHVASIGFSPQGRYLFPSIIPIIVFASIFSWQQSTRRLNALLLLLGLLTQIYAIVLLMLWFYLY